MKNFKKITLGLLGAALLTLGLYSCGNDDTTKTHTTSVQTTLLGSKTDYRVKSSDFRYIGIQHNEILDGIRKSLLSKEVDLDNLQDFSVKFIYSEIEKIYIDEKDLNLASNLIKKNIKAVPDYSKSFYSYEQGKTISSELKVYLNELHSMMQIDDDFQLDILLKNIEILENQALNDTGMKNEDLMKFYVSTNVAKSSLEYWTENSDQWDYLLNDGKTMFSQNKPPRKTPGRRIGEIAVADVGGAVGGATYAWVANVVPGVGQATYAGAIVGGAITCSVAAGVYHLAASIFDWD